MVNEVCRQEQAERCIKAVAHAKQGQWMRWEEVERRKLSWKELWGMEAHRTSFLMGSVCDVLPSPTNLSLWYGEGGTCPMCSSPGSLKHILAGCKTSLEQGRYTWRHNQVLRCLAGILERRRTTINALPAPSPKSTPTITFISGDELGKNQIGIRPRTRIPGCWVEHGIGR